MTIDLWCLVGMAVWLFMLTIPVLFARQTVAGGLDWGFGNREMPLEGVPAWGKRAERAHANMLENIAPFAIAVLVVHVTAHANETSALGSVVFVVGRILHAAVYIAGIKYLRTAVFFGSQMGLLLVLLQLF